jgi:hypothetical protein
MMRSLIIGVAWPHACHSLRINQYAMQCQFLHMRRSVGNQVAVTGCGRVLVVDDDEVELSWKAQARESMSQGSLPCERCIFETNTSITSLTSLAAAQCMMMMMMTMARHTCSSAPCHLCHVAPSYTSLQFDHQHQVLRSQPQSAANRRESGAHKQSKKRRHTLLLSESAKISSQIDPGHKNQKERTSGGRTTTHSSRRRRHHSTVHPDCCSWSSCVFRTKAQCRPSAFVSNRLGCAAASHWRHYDVCVNLV